MKTVLVIDIPEGENINECVADIFIHDLNVRGIANYNDVPLRPLPKRYDEDLMREQKGWNRCLDEITGESDEYLR